MILSAMPPSGASGAGLTYGFMHAITHPYYFIAICMVLAGFIQCRTIHWTILPMTFVLVFLCSGLWHGNIGAAPYLPYLYTALALLNLLLCCYINSYNLCLIAIITCSTAYHLGIISSLDKPATANALYYLFGQTIAIGLVLGSIGCILLLFFSKDITEENAEQ
jgi:hypothetical protein